MEFFISAGVAYIVEAIQDKKAIIKHADKFAKVFVKIERAAEQVPTLAAAIERQRQKQ